METRLPEQPTKSPRNRETATAEGEAGANQCIQQQWSSEQSSKSSFQLQIRPTGNPEQSTLVPNQADLGGEGRGDPPEQGRRRGSCKSMVRSTTSRSPQLEGRDNQINHQRCARRSRQCRWRQNGREAQIQVGASRSEPGGEEFIELTSDGSTPATRQSNKTMATAAMAMANSRQGGMRRNTTRSLLLGARTTSRKGGGGGGGEIASRLSHFGRQAQDWLLWKKKRNVDSILCRANVDVLLAHSMKWQTPYLYVAHKNQVLVGTKKSS